ncbi:MAG: hypothetical protein AAB325_16335 [Pseudomonadota bacterium]
MKIKKEKRHNYKLGEKSMFKKNDLPQTEDKAINIRPILVMAEGAV